MRRILIISGVIGILLGAFIGKASGETFTKSEFIKMLKKGDKIPHHTAQFYYLNSKMDKNEELLVTDISGGQVNLKAVRVIKLGTDNGITQQEFWRRSLTAQEKR